MRSSLKIRLSGTQRRASKTSTKAQGQARSPPEPRDKREKPKPAYRSPGTQQAKLDPRRAPHARPSPEGNHPQTEPGETVSSHHGRARLRREEQSRKTPLCDDGDLARRARELQLLHRSTVKLFANVDNHFDKMLTHLSISFFAKRVPTCLKVSTLFFFFFFFLKDITAPRQRRLARRVTSGKGLKQKSEFFA